MRLIYILLTAIAMLSLISCGQGVPTKTVQAKHVVSMSTYRNMGDLHMEFLIPDGEWSYTSVLSDDGMEYSLVVRDMPHPLSTLEPIRPVISFDQTTYPSGFKLVFKLVSRHKLYTEKTDYGLGVVLTALEPDMEMVSMQNFGGWADPQKSASTFQGADVMGESTLVRFDNPVVYSTGEAGGNFYVDIFGINLLPGLVKFKGLMAENVLKGKTRLIFKKPVKVCPEMDMLTLGKKCEGYSSVVSFEREKNERTESFQFTLPGMPEVKVRELDGLVAFGFENTRLFTDVFKRYSDSDVYKVEARQKDGLLWLVFLYTGELKYRKYYSGDKFFVVFYR